MKRNARFMTVLAVIFLIAVFVSTEALAQPGSMGPGSRWWFIGTPLAGEGIGSGSAAGESGTGGGGGLTLPGGQLPIETIQGTVVSVQDMRGVSGSEQMMVRTPQGDNWTVYLGPRWFVDNQRLKINSGDQVEVRGAKVLYAGRSDLIAADVSKGDMTMRLRNSDGLPSWECCFPRRPAPAR